MALGTELWALAAGVLVGAAVQSALGFGAMLVATLVGALFLPTDQLMPLLLPLSTLQTAVVVLRTGRHVDRPFLFRRVLPFVGLGMAAGALGPGIAASGTRPLLGGLVLGLAALELTRRGPPPPLPRPVAALVLVAGGVVQSLLGTGGPLVVWAIGREDLPRTTFRSTLNALWFATNSALLTALAIQGRLDGPTLLRSALLGVPALGGVALGLAVHDRLDEAAFRKVLWLVLGACAVPLVLS